MSTQPEHRRRAAVYIRVSRQRIEAGESLEAHKEPFNRFAEEQGMDVVAWYVDEYRSESVGARREEFKQLVEECGIDPAAEGVDEDPGESGI